LVFDFPALGGRYFLLPLRADACAEIFKEARAVFPEGTL